MWNKQFLCWLAVLEVSLVRRSFSIGSDPVPPPADPAFIKKLLDSHNWLRTTVIPPASNMLYMVMWADTYKVGCAAHRCLEIEGYGAGKNLVLFVCHYGPKGNIPGKKPFLDGESCSECPNDKCVENLCRNEERDEVKDNEDWMPFLNSCYLSCIDASVFGLLFMSLIFITVWF